MQNKPNSKTEDSKIMAKDTPNVFYNCRESSTNRPLFMQNKPNFKIGKMNITSATTWNYINELRTTNYDLIMKTNPNKANFKPGFAKCS